MYDVAMCAQNCSDYHFLHYNKQLGIYTVICCHVLVLAYFAVSINYAVPFIDFFWLIMLLLF